MGAMVGGLPSARQASLRILARGRKKRRLKGRPCNRGRPMPLAAPPVWAANPDTSASLPFAARIGEALGAVPPLRPLGTGQHGGEPIRDPAAGNLLGRGTTNAGHRLAPKTPSRSLPNAPMVAGPAVPSRQSRELSRE